MKKPARNVDSSPLVTPSILGVVGEIVDCFNLAR